ncbi:isoprenylcysteine carboxylmethyltransferase family protein [Polaromonas sp.]|uniref:methyltransferase family protein n=1 Tax=Polaromonas sp. TaxID=1869339 RepID=UPI00286AE5D8|nr:isoprenylcysteine carboxylmethyltransferase family protein [Polaromonas sp.]
MQALELKIPPPAVAALTAGAMWGLSVLAPLVALAPALRVTAALLIALVGAGFDLAGIIAFWRAKTTVNPMKPDTSVALVCTGVYRFTRNPMYVGLALILLAWAVYLSSGWALLGPVAFGLYITRFQIRPEERVLAARFGSRYAAYQAGVPRWL